MLLDAIAGLAGGSRVLAHVIVPADGPVREAALASGAAVTIVALPPSVAAMGDYGRSSPAAILRLGVRLIVMLPSLLAYARRLRAAITAVRPDIVHSNGLKMHLLTTLVALRGTPVVWHLHDYVGRRAVLARLIRTARWRCAVAIANSADVAADARALFGDSPRIEVLHNPVDLSRFTPEGPSIDLDAVAGLPPAPDGCIRVGLIATFALWKGHRVFLQAMARVARRHSVRAYVIGGPIYTTESSQESLAALRQVAVDEGIGESTGFTGFLADTAAAMRSLDIVVHASIRPEPFGLVIAEAMAMGLPVITSASGGAAEIVLAGETALVHVPGDADSLAGAIEALCESPELRREIGRRAHADALARFNRQPFADALAAIYRRVAA